MNLKYAVKMKTVIKIDKENVFLKKSAAEKKSEKNVKTARKQKQSAPKTSQF